MDFWVPRRSRHKTAVVLVRVTAAKAVARATLRLAAVVKVRVAVAAVVKVRVAEVAEGARSEYRSEPRFRGRKKTCSAAGRTTVDQSRP